MPDDASPIERPSNQVERPEPPAFSGSGSGVAPTSAFADPAVLTRVLDDPERDEWQRPDDLLHALELAPTMTVAEVGAGTGYFAVRLARALPGGEVIATDIEPEMVRFLNERAEREHLPNLRAIPATHTASGLTAGTVDRILMVHAWHHLASHSGFAEDLKAALRPEGRLFVVDYNLDALRGPPADIRIGPERLIAELENAGLVAKFLAVQLPDQYVVEASCKREQA